MSTAEKASNLYVKSFFAASVAAAMAQAQRELGPDALLLNSREAPPEARHLGEYEVVFGSWPQLPVPSPVSPVGPVALSRREELHHRIFEIRRMIGRMGPALAARSGDDPGVARALIEAGVESELAHSIERAVRKRLSKGAVLDIAKPHAAPAREPQSWTAATAEELASRFEVRPEIGPITALIGPPGSGKTTTLVKLAISQCLQQGRAVRLISADTLRVGAAEQLRTYAAILGVPFQAAESTMALAQAIDSTPANTYTLIDTPGFSASMQQDLGGELTQFLTSRQEIDTHLVLTASMERYDLRCITDRFSSFRPSKLIFTRLDEATSCAAAFSESARLHKPLSFLCHGQLVPEDLRLASKNLVIDSLVRQLPEALRAVA